MKVIVVGLGVQGYKRKRFAGSDFVASIDPMNSEADYKRIEEVPSDHYDAALVCTPDAAKQELLAYLLGRGKHVLVEKPLRTAEDDELKKLEDLANRTGAICYTAYNHRFEPHFVRMRALLDSGELGRIYRCRMFYGNGTARLVRESAWRDQDAGVLPDLGSHLLDTINYWFGPTIGSFQVTEASCFENKSPDHVVVSMPGGQLKIELEMTLLQWRNHFTCDILAEKGSAHIRSLCKWGPSAFIHRKRVLPSGRPAEEAITLVQDDPTWAEEYSHFKRLIQSRQPTNLEKDLWLQRIFRELSEEAMKKLAQ